MTGDWSRREGRGWGKRKGSGVEGRGGVGRVVEWKGGGVEWCGAVALVIITSAVYCDSINMIMLIESHTALAFRDATFQVHKKWKVCENKQDRYLRLSNQLFQA